MEFTKYMHIEKLGHTEVEGIENGRVYIFPKLDGTNGSLWVNNINNDQSPIYELFAGSRNRQLTKDQDNHGFFDTILDNQKHLKFLAHHPHLKLYGEWLVPHTLKTYKADSWRKFYVFDVYDEIQHRLLTYEEYYPILEKHDIDFIPCQAIYSNGVNQDVLLKEAQKNTYLIPEGQGAGEGIVIKNYDFFNRYGRQVWAKLLLNEFKDKRHEPSEKKQRDSVEYKAVCKYCTLPMIDKVIANLPIDAEPTGQWTGKLIPRLLHTVFYDLVREHAWDMVKEFKNPTIDFKELKWLVTNRVKDYKRELF